MNSKMKRYGLAVSVWHFIDRAIYAIEDEPEYNAALSHLANIAYPLTELEDCNLQNEKTIIKAIRGIVSKCKHTIEHEKISTDDKNRAVDYLLAASGLAMLLSESIKDGSWS